MGISLLLTLLSAGLFILSFPEGPLPLLAFVCLVPLTVALSRAGPRGGLLLGFAYGFIIWLASVWWLSNGFYLYVELSWWASWLWTVVGCLVAALPYGAFGLFFGLSRGSQRPYGPLRAALALTVLIAWYPLLFPGSHVHALYDYPLLVQTLDLAGVPGLLFLLNLVNFLAAWAILDLIRRRNPAKHLAPLIFALVFMVGYGSYRLNQLHSEMGRAWPGRTVKIISIQPNLPIMRAGVPHFFGPDKTFRDAGAVLAMTADAVQKHPDAHLAVWPELPGAMPTNPEYGVWKAVRGLAVGSGIPFLVNCAEYDPKARGDYNNAQIITAKGGFGPRYRKMILFPFGEYLPFEKRLPWLRKLFPHALNYIAGKETTLLPIAGKDRGIALLCYEVLFPGLIRRFVAAGGEVIVNMVDDAWFGASDASAIHMALAVYRTVEYRVPLVRVTNSGNGVFIQPTGEMVPGSRTPVFEEAVTAFPLYLAGKRTVYFRIRDALLWAFTALFCLELILALASRRNVPEAR